VEEQEEYHRNIGSASDGHHASQNINTVMETTEKRRGAIKSLGIFQSAGSNAVKKSHTII